VRCACVCDCVPTRVAQTHFYDFVDTRSDSDNALLMRMRRFVREDIASNNQRWAAALEVRRVWGEHRHCSQCARGCVCVD
jgi:hypothetical protein